MHVRCLAPSGDLAHLEPSPFFPLACVAGVVLGILKSYSTPICLPSRSLFCFLETGHHSIPLPECMLVWDQLEIFCLWGRQECVKKETGETPPRAPEGATPASCPLKAHYSRHYPLRPHGGAAGRAKANPRALPAHTCPAAADARGGLRAAGSKPGPGVLTLRVTLKSKWSRKTWL